LLDRSCGLVDFKFVLSQLPGTPGISDGLHAKMSTLSLRKLVSASSYLGLRSADDDFLGCVRQAEANLLDS
jgi:hypothetical protein